MKRFIILSICWYITASCYSQNYVAEYLSGETNCRLTFNVAAWRYDVTTPMEFTFESNDIDVSEISKPEAVLISSFNFRSLDKNYYLDEEIVPPITSNYVIKGNLIKPEWIIVSDSVKTIEGYTCLMAKGHVRGRDYTVWFTPDIPVSAGPWKLWGLPGLIVSGQSDDGVVKNFTLISLKQTDLTPEEPVVEKTVSPEEFKSLLREEAKKFSRKMRSLSGEGLDIDVKININIHPDKSLLE